MQVNSRNLQSIIWRRSPKKCHVTCLKIFTLESACWVYHLEKRNGYGSQRETMSFGEENSPMMMQFLHNSCPSDQMYLESREDGCHNCEVGPSHETEKRKNSGEDIK